MSSQIAKNVVLDLGSEDFYGLWEILWRLRELCPDRGEADLLEDARSAIIHLMRDGAICIYWRETIDAEPKPITDNPESVLSKSEVWNEPKLGTSRAVLVAVKD